MGRVARNRVGARRARLARSTRCAGVRVRGACGRWCLGVRAAVPRPGRAYRHGRPASPSAAGRSATALERERSRDRRERTRSDRPPSSRLATGVHVLETDEQRQSSLASGLLSHLHESTRRDWRFRRKRPTTRMGYAGADDAAAEPARVPEGSNPVAPSPLGGSCLNRGPKKRPGAPRREQFSGRGCCRSLEDSPWGCGELPPRSAAVANRPALTRAAQPGPSRAP
jgi:hypothetical protein